jgi:two-component system sensor histidine kinase KdpD
MFVFLFVDYFRVETKQALNSRSVQSPTAQARFSWQRYLVTAAVVALCSVAGWISSALGLTSANIVMIFLAGVALVAARFGRGPAIAAAISSVLVFDYFFVPPVLSFAPSDAQYFIDLAVMLGIGLLISELTARLQKQLHASREHEQRLAQLYQASQEQERRTAQLYQMTRQLSKMAGTEILACTAGQQLTEVFAGDVVLYLREPDGALRLRYGDDTSLAKDATSRAIIEWVATHARAAGMGTDTLPSATPRFVPMVGSQQTVGVLAVRPQDSSRFADPEEQRMLETCANLIALSIERDQSLSEAHQAQVQVQSEQLRNALLSSVSHDLRTPLAMIAVTASSLLDESAAQGEMPNREMLQTVVDESNRLSRQVENLLDMARLSSGSIVLNRDWQVLEELVGVALSRLRRELSEYSVEVVIPIDFPLLWVADDLMEQVLVNLLDNAIRYTPKGSQIIISAVRCEGRAEIRIADNGPGLRPGSESKVFEKFFRGKMVVADGQRGIGLGLAICQGIVQAHGGEIRAANRPGGGVEFIISLPCPAQSPQVGEEACVADSHPTSAGFNC